MKNEKVCRTLSLKVRHKSVLIHDQSQNLKLFYKPILSFLSPLTPFKRTTLPSSKLFDLAAREKEQIFKRWLIEENRKKEGGKVQQIQRSHAHLKTNFLLMGSTTLLNAHVRAKKHSYAQTLLCKKTSGFLHTEGNAQTKFVHACVQNHRFCISKAFAIRRFCINFVCTTYKEPQDCRTYTLRSCNLFSRRQIKYQIIRPLLDFKRESITALCKDLCISIYPDKSNRLLQYSRNRIRKQIIPSIKYFLNPQVENSLFKLAELLGKKQSFVSSLLKNSSKSTRPYF